MSFRHSTRVRFHDADPAGIAFFSKVLTWCHDAYEEMMRALGCPLEALVREGRWGLPLVHAEADYQRPMAAGLELHVDVRVVALGDRSFTLAYTLSDAAGVSHATGRTVHVVIDRATGRPAAIPDPIREALTQHRHDG